MEDRTVNSPIGLWQWFLVALVAGAGWTLGCSVIGFAAGALTVLLKK